MAKPQVARSKRQKIRQDVRSECRTYSIRPIDLADATGVSHAACCKLVAGTTKDIRSDVAMLFDMWLLDREKLKEEGKLPRFTGKSEPVSALTVAENMQLREKLRKAELEIHELRKTPDMFMPEVPKEAPPMKSVLDRVHKRLVMYAAMLEGCDDALLSAGSEDMMKLANLIKEL
jgi:hypothetical protein